MARGSSQQSMFVVIALGFLLIFFGTATNNASFVQLGYGIVVIGILLELVTVLDRR